MALKVLRVSSYTGGLAGPSLPMLGPLEDGGTIVAETPPGCWGPIITPHFRGGHEVTQPVAVEGAHVGDAIAIKIEDIKLKSRATASGTSEMIEGRRLATGRTVVTRCPGCGASNPPTVVNGIGHEAIRCGFCGSEAIPAKMTCGYTMVFDDERMIGVAVDHRGAEHIANHAREYACLPPSSEQHSVLILAKADLVGILARTRPLVGNIGTTPAIDVGDAANRGDVARFVESSTSDERCHEHDLPNPLTDAHMDIDSVREGSLIICPVKVEGGGVYVGDVHAMQGHGEVAGHTTDVAAEVRLRVRVIPGLSIDGPIICPPVEDLPLLARPFNKDETEKGRRLAAEWGVELERVAPIQVVGTGGDLNAAVRSALARAAALLDCSVDEVRNRVTITGSLEIGHSGAIKATLLAPIARLRELGIGDLIREQYPSLDLV